MDRLQKTSQPVVATLRRLLHSSNRTLAADSRHSGPSSSPRRADVSTPVSPRSARGGRAAGPSMEATQLNRTMSQARTAGRYYSPSYLNLEERAAAMQRVPRRYPALGPSAAVAKKIDPLYRLGLRPGHPSLHDDSYKNPELLSQYVSEMGKIMGRRNTELTRRSQREVGKAIRRARSMGLMPVMSRNLTAWKVFNK